MRITQADVGVKEEKEEKEQKIPATTGTLLPWMHDVRDVLRQFFKSEGDLVVLSSMLQSDGLADPCLVCKTTSTLNPKP